MQRTKTLLSQAMLVIAATKIRLLFDPASSMSLSAYCSNVRDRTSKSFKAQSLVVAWVFGSARRCNVALKDGTLYHSVLRAPICGAWSPAIIHRCAFSTIHEQVLFGGINSITANRSLDLGSDI